MVKEVAGLAIDKNNFQGAATVEAVRKERPTLMKSSKNTRVKDRVWERQDLSEVRVASSVDSFKLVGNIPVEVQRAVRLVAPWKKSISAGSHAGGSACVVNVVGWRRNGISISALECAGLSTVSG